MTVKNRVTFQKQKIVSKLVLILSGFLQSANKNEENDVDFAKLKLQGA